MFNRNEQLVQGAMVYPDGSYEVGPYPSNHILPLSKAQIQLSAGYSVVINVNDLPALLAVMRK